MLASATLSPFTRMCTNQVELRGAGVAEMDSCLGAITYRGRPVHITTLKKLGFLDYNSIFLHV